MNTKKALAIRNTRVNKQQRLIRKCLSPQRWHSSNYYLQYA